MHFRASLSINGIFERTHNDRRVIPRSKTDDLNILLEHLLLEQEQEYDSSIGYNFMDFKMRIVSFSRTLGM